MTNSLAKTVNASWTWMVVEDTWLKIWWMEVAGLFLQLTIGLTIVVPALFAQQSDWYSSLPQKAIMDLWEFPNGLPSNENIMQRIDAAYENLFRQMPNNKFYPCTFCDMLLTSEADRSSVSLDIMYKKRALFCWNNAPFVTFFWQVKQTAGQIICVFGYYVQEKGIVLLEQCSSPRRLPSRNEGLLQVQKATMDSLDFPNVLPSNEDIMQRIDAAYETLFRLLPIYKFYLHMCTCCDMLLTNEADSRTGHLCFWTLCTRKGHCFVGTMFNPRRQPSGNEELL